METRPECMHQTELRASLDVRGLILQMILLKMQKHFRHPTDTCKASVSSSMKYHTTEKTITRSGGQRTLIRVGSEVRPGVKGRVFLNSTQHISYLYPNISLLSTPGSFRQRSQSSIFCTQSKKDLGWEQREWRGRSKQMNEAGWVGLL